MAAHASAKDSDSRVLLRPRPPPAPRHSPARDRAVHMRHAFCGYPRSSRQPRIRTQRSQCCERVA
eukprot:2408795-Rhodomonas_salina.3